MEIRELLNVIPPSCTLPTAERPFRLAEFDELFTSALAVHRVSPVLLRLTLPGDAEVASRAADLAVRENACCSFFEFTLRVGGGTVSLDVVVPPQHTAVLDGFDPLP